MRRFLAAFTLFLCGCGAVKQEEPSGLPHRFASESEAASLLLANQEYYDGFSQNDIDYRMQKKDASMEEVLAFAGEQALAFSDEETALIDGFVASMEKTLQDNRYTLPALDEIAFIKTTGLEEGHASAYTHGTQIFLNEELLQYAAAEDEEEREEGLEILQSVLWHELFHCLTRCNPEFRVKMYELIHFTVAEEDFPLPPSVFAYHISNPDVEHHNAFASFSINGQETECFVDTVTTKHFEEPGDLFFDYITTALISTDGTDVYYTPEQADNFDCAASRMSVRGTFFFFAGGFAENGSCFLLTNTP